MAVEKSTELLGQVIPVSKPKEHTEAIYTKQSKDDCTMSTVPLAQDEVQHWVPGLTKED